MICAAVNLFSDLSWFFCAGQLFDLSRADAHVDFAVGFHAVWHSTHVHSPDRDLSHAILVSHT